MCKGRCKWGFQFIIRRTRSTPFLSNLYKRFIAFGLCKAERYGRNKIMRVDLNYRLEERIADQVKNFGVLRTFFEKVLSHARVLSEVKALCSKNIFKERNV